jgi:hypothetical protein
MPCVGFELTIPASERANTVYALDRSATVTGFLLITYLNFTTLRGFRICKFPLYLKLRKVLVPEVMPLSGYGNLSLLIFLK